MQNRPGVGAAAPLVDIHSTSASAHTHSTAYKLKDLLLPDFLKLYVFEVTGYMMCFYQVFFETRGYVVV